MYGGVSVSNCHWTAGHRANESGLAGSQDKLLVRVPRTTKDLHPDQPEGRSG